MVGKNATNPISPMKGLATLSVPDFENVAPCVALCSTLCSTLNLNFVQAG
jgi:hypothetical protein